MHSTLPWEPCPGVMNCNHCGDTAADLMVQNSMNYYEPEHDPFSDYIPTFGELTDAEKPLILSASGWRKIFAPEGDEESTTPDISAADKVLAGAAALCFVEFLRSQEIQHPLVWIACDSRPTGPGVLDIMLRVFISLDVKVKATFITAAPELMSAVKLDNEAHGFAYITASHNPVGHNGLKFGGSNGAVYGGAYSAELISRYKALLKSPAIIERVTELCRKTDVDTYRSILESVPTFKKRAAQKYSGFTRQVVSGSEEPAKQAAFFEGLKDSLKNTPTGVLGELNGSARSTSIDRHFLEEAGFLVEMHNDTPQEIVHPIVPEGKNLDLCRDLLLKANEKNSAFTLGYVPDNDGDRGNLVFINRSSRDGCNAPAPRVIEAQEVFGLVVLAELAYQEYLSRGTGLKEPSAVVVNGPTSMRIEGIARAFGAEVFRAEVGEANAVNLAEELRTKGYQVRILGEGSNGGNITHPSTVRDPLDTVFSLSKLIAFRGKQEQNQMSDFNPYAQWCRSGETSAVYTPDFNLSQVLESLPPFTTTSAYEAEAKMHIKTRDHAALKRHWEEVFLEEWEHNKEFLRSSYGIVSWREVNYEGTTARTGFGHEYRSGSEKGGLKIIFSNEAGEDTDFIWMRGSGTEPVFRVLADSYGRDPKRHEWLLQWHRSMITSADSV